MAIGTTAALITGGLLAGGSAAAKVISGNKQAKAIEKGAQQQEQFGREAMGLLDPATEEANRRLQEALGPYAKAGELTLDRLIKGLQPGGEFSKEFSGVIDDPGYKFRLSEGTRNVERGAAARGGLFSGGSLRDLTEFSQGLASQEYGNAFNRFASERDKAFDRTSSLLMPGYNASATIGSQTGQNLMDTARQKGQFLTGIGNVRASGTVNANRARTGGWNSAMDSMMKLPELFGSLRGTGGFSNRPLRPGEYDGRQGG